MLVVAVVAAIATASGLAVWAALLRWSPDPAAPKIDRATIDASVASHPRLRRWLHARRDPATLTGFALSAAVVMVAAGFGIVGLLLVMVRTHTGFAEWDLAAARFGARHASGASTRTLRALTQLGGAVLLVPLAVVFAAVASYRQHRWRPIVGFLAVCVGGQFLVANLVKFSVDRARPDLSRLTGFSGSSFPSGHATASAATFAAMALVAGRGRSRPARAALGGLAVALTVAVASSRVLLGVHWLTDVLAGMALGWGWFAVSSLAFGGRLLRFGELAVEAEDAADTVGSSARPLAVRKTAG